MKTAPLAWSAPAKLNLCLYIVGRRADGYHLLQSAMQFVDLCDELRFHERPAGTIERIAGPADIPAESDIAMKAARALAKGRDVPGVGIELHKRIPVQGGLGGGSSDAATVLVALNQIWELRLSVDELARIGLTLGADVPFFVRGAASWVEGVGEQLTPYDFPEKHYLIVKPQASVSTAEIFQAPELTRNSPITTIRGFLAAGGRNDCTACVRGRYPEIAEALDWLQEFGEARLTGTGACVFVALPDERTAQAIRARLPARWSGYVARGLNRSPLLSRVTDR
ncbi:MAG TPA: 4-(cytidine 5'-diphospho)-2-C-methyl-D-erythritol kinase [Steroidobacteraceae bacterium]|jgi:4-diphosphocytidyl-2-C-methyl-D-erythritol kinase|nr:4-(cytidine 5'-diphospho)-2-C-methyl-D-erythritol kinase [Steroidobacteraceae bacterium]